MDDLQKEWNKRLSKDGLAVVRGSEKVAVGIVGSGRSQSTMEVLKNINEVSRGELENLLEKFELLSAEAQKNILTDLEVARNNGMDSREIFRRFESLVSQIKDMEDVTMFTTSDRKAPELPPSIDKDADDFAKKRVEEIINGMKRIIEERKKLDEENRKKAVN